MRTSPSSPAAIRASLVALLSCIAPFHPAHAAQPAPVRVRVVRVQQRDLQRTLHLAATVAPTLWGELPAPVTGFVRELFADVGTRVKRGQVLASVEPAAGHAAHAPTLLAPFSGEIVRRAVHPGAYVTVGAPLFTLLNQDEVRALVAVPERDSALLRVGQHGMVRVPAYPNRVYQGTLTLAVPEIDGRTHSRAVELSLANPDHSLVAGMSGLVELEVERHDHALVVPKKAVVIVDGAAFVFRASGDRALRAPINVGLEDGDWLEVVSGVADGDEIVVSDAPLVDGASISLR